MKIRGKISAELLVIFYNIRILGKYTKGAILHDPS